MHTEQLLVMQTEFETFAYAGRTCLVPPLHLRNRLAIYPCILTYNSFSSLPPSFGGQKRPGNVAQLRAHIVKLCRALSEDLCRKVVTNARVRLQEVVRQNGGHIEHVLH